MSATTCKAVTPYPLEVGNWGVEFNGFLYLRGKVGERRPTGDRRRIVAFFLNIFMGWFVAVLIVSLLLLFYLYHKAAGISSVALLVRLTCTI